jgi:N-methylhydantoinase B/oxoprolinase/acetone carboxylase alpha subunit
VGEISLDHDAARVAVSTISEATVLDSVEAAAAGIIDIVNENMLGALRLVSVQQGFDPRDFALVAFGGAGPLHANALGRLTGAWPVIIPPSPGVLSAYGDATTSVRDEAARTYIRAFSDLSDEELRAVMDELASTAKATLSSQGIAADQQVLTYQVDLRYHGQGFEIPVEIDITSFDSEQGGIAALRSAFDAEHERLFSFLLDNEQELVNVRAAASGPRPDVVAPVLPEGDGDPAAALRTSTQVWVDGSEVEAQVYDRAKAASDGRRPRARHRHRDGLNHPGSPRPRRDGARQREPLDPPDGGMTAVAQIIETSTTPLKRVDVDVITLDLVENALRNARYEMDEVLFRTALSPGIREQHDEFPLIGDPDGKMVVGQFGLSIPDFLANFDGTIEEGDVLLTSDPYSCGAAISHANDWLVVMPIFVEGRVVGWSSMFGHMSDVGGKSASSMPTDARTIFEEGVVIPPFKLYSKGELAHDSLRIILNQVRKPDWNRADLNGIVAACRTASRRVQELCARFGVDTYVSALDALLDRNYRAMKTLLHLVFQEGKTLSFTDYICDDGVGYGPYELKLSLTRTGDKVHLDFTGSAPQARGPINYYINENLVRMFFGIYMITVADPQILWNDGFYPLIDVTIPEDSFWKPRYPAALNARNHGIGRVFDLFGGLLGQTNPSLLNAAGFSSSPHFMYSGNYGEGDRKGEWFQLYSIGFGGIPGRPIGDGPDGHSLWPSFVNIPCEYLESYYPMRIELWETVADTGGAGVHRGGNGVDVAYRFLEPGTVAIHDDRWLTYPWGVNGGKPGARGRSGCSARTAARRSSAARSVTCRSRPEMCCTSSPGEAGVGAIRWHASPTWWPSRCAVDW